MLTLAEFLSVVGFVTAVAAILHYLAWRQIEVEITDRKALDARVTEFHERTSKELGALAEAVRRCETRHSGTGGT